MNQFSQFIWDNPSNYRKCQKKQYDIHVCMPPKGTIVINALEQADTVKYFNGKTYFTLRDLAKLSDNAKQSVMNAVSCGKAYMVNDNTPFVLAGTCGELSVISPSELAQNYNFLQGNQPVGINQQNLNQRMTGEYLKWTLVRLKPSMVNYMACRVPTSIRTNIQTKFGVGSINHQGVSHGKGDFVVCNKLPNGKPDFSTRFVVNGNVFASTFNNQGWQDSIKDAKTVNISNLPNLVPNDVVAEKPIDAKTFRSKCDTLIKELQKIYKFTISSNNYELVKDYRGIAKEVTFKGDTYVAKFTVSGNFSHTYHGKNGDNEVKANETFVYFGCSTHQDSALFMSIHPKTDNIYLTGWTFPSKGSESRSGYDYPKSKAGGIFSINCADEAKYFLNNNKGDDFFIDNRDTNKENEEQKDYSKEFDIFYDLFKTKISSIVDILDDKIYKNNNKSLRVNGDNDDYLALKFTLDNDKVLISGRSDKKSFNGKYIVTSEEDISKSVDEVLKTLRVSPLRREIKKLSEYFKSKGDKYKCSSVRFKSSNTGFFFRFIINNELQFTYSIWLPKNKLAFTSVKDRSDKKLSYSFDVLKGYSADKIYEQVSFIFTQENSSWKGIFKDLSEMFDSVKNIYHLAVNKGEGYFWFYEFKHYKYFFELDSYTDASYIFRCVSFSDKKKSLSDKQLVLEKGLRGTNLSDKVIDYINSLQTKEETIKKVEKKEKINNEKLLSILKKAHKDYDELIYSDLVQSKLTKYEDDCLNANLIYRLFLTMADINDCSIWTSSGKRFDLGYYCYNFSLDDDIFITGFIDEDECEEGIAIRQGSSFYTIDRGTYTDVTIDNIELVLSNIVKSDCDYIPYQLDDFYSYDFSLDFWFSYEHILEFLEDCISEFESYNKLSDDTLFELKKLVNAPNSKVIIPDFEELFNNDESTSSSTQKFDTGLFDFE